MITYMIDAKTDRPNQPPVHQIWLKRISSDSTGWDHVWKTSFFSRLSDVLAPPIIRSFTLSDRVVSWEPGDSTEMITLEMREVQEADEDRFVFVVTPDNGSFTITQDIHERMMTWAEPMIQITRKRTDIIETGLGTTVVEGFSLAYIHLRDTP
jgi:hypothetical protein